MASANTEISKNEYEGMKETIKVLQDSEMVEAIEEGLERLQEGKTRDWDEVKKILDI